MRFVPVLFVLFALPIAAQPVTVPSAAPTIGVFAESGVGSLSADAGTSPALHVAAGISIHGHRLYLRAERSATTRYGDSGTFDMARYAVLYGRTFGVSERIALSFGAGAAVVSVDSFGAGLPSTTRLGSTFEAGLEARLVQHVTLVTSASTGSARAFRLGVRFGR